MDSRIENVSIDRSEEWREENLVFVGLVGMIDPPRDEVKEAVHKCHDAGIRPVMITGDHPATALAIARELRIASTEDRALTGQELDSTSDEGLTQQVDKIAVYARVSPEHKLRVVKALQSRGQVVAMTGDGVNDAPAVKKADIGIAMGITGTDVTKEASDMVLTDDNFASIVSAVEEGRCIYDNIQKVLLFLLSCNAGEVLVMLVASVLGWPAPLLPIQLLWMNLVTDGLPALALSLEPPEPGIMRRKPRPPSEAMLSLATGAVVLWHGSVLAMVTLTGFYVSQLWYPDDIGRARSISFCVLVYGQLLIAISSRSTTLTLWQVGVFTNPAILAAIVLSAVLQVGVVSVPFAQSVFGAVAQSLDDWMLVLVLAFVPVSVIESTKIAMFFFRNRRHTNAP